MRKDKPHIIRPFVLILAGLLLFSHACAQNSDRVLRIEVSDLDQQIRSFLQTQILTHLEDIKTLDPPPDRVVGALTTGEFSWGTFMRTLGAYSQFTGSTTIGGRDILPMISKMAQIEVFHGGKTWAQLYAAMALRSFGADLNHNVLWRSMTVEEQNTYRTLFDPGRFYDAKTHTLIHLPDNYLGVAARIAAIDYELGLNKDRTALDDLLTRAAKQFTDGALFADDAPPTGRYDRYSNEYARAVYEAAEIARRNDICKAVAPSLTEQMKLWWDLLSEDGYGYSWGRSLGAISYMDTMEIAAFLGKYPEFRPAPLPQLAAAYFAAWSWLRNDFNDHTHLLRVFDFGRGDYSYITKEREWQQTTTFFGKVISAHERFLKALETEGVNSFPSWPGLRDVARFQYFRNGPGRKFGVWVVRQGELHFALPFVTGPKAATSDYEPVPHGFPGIAVPVEKIYPCLLPFIEMEDGQTIAAADGTDEIKVADDGRMVTATWRHWVVVGKNGEDFVDRNLVSEVTWSLQGRSLHRVESLTASRPLKIQRLWLAIPSRYNHLETHYDSGARTDRLLSDEKKTLDIQVKQSDLPFQISVNAPGNEALGRGDRGPLPIHLLFQTNAFALLPGISKHWELSMSAY